MVYVLGNNKGLDGKVLNDKVEMLRFRSSPFDLKGLPAGRVGKARSHSMDEGEGRYVLRL